MKNALVEITFKEIHNYFPHRNKRYSFHKISTWDYKKSILSTRILKIKKLSEIKNSKKSLKIKPRKYSRCRTKRENKKKRASIYVIQYLNNFQELLEKAEKRNGIKPSKKYVFWIPRIEKHNSRLKCPLKVHHSKMEKDPPIPLQRHDCDSLTNWRKRRSWKLLNVNKQKCLGKEQDLESHWNSQLQHWKLEDNGEMTSKFWEKNYFQFRYLYPEKLCIEWEGCRYLMQPIFSHTPFLRRLLEDVFH